MTPQNPKPENGVGLDAGFWSVCHGYYFTYLLTGSKQTFKMESDLMESYVQQFSHNTAEIVSTTTKIPTLYGSKTDTGRL